jgi:hypothetical protein
MRCVSCSALSTALCHTRRCRCAQPWVVLSVGWWAGERVMVERQVEAARTAAGLSENPVIVVLVPGVRESGTLHYTDRA